MKHITKLTAVLLAGVMLAGCAGNGGGQSSSKELNAADYETDERLMTIVDVPPSPFLEEDMKLYTDLGFTHYVLTEDFTAMAENGKLSESYKQAIQNLTDAGLEVWIRNHNNDYECFVVEQERTGSNYGAHYTVSPRSITDDFNAFPAVTGFYMMDEPFQYTLEDDPSTEDNESLHPAVDQLGTLIDWKNTYYPDLFWHINHVSNSSWNHWPSDTSYSDFLDYYIENVLDKLEGKGGKSLCMDHYPFHDGNGLCIDFLYSTLAVANATRDYNATAAEDQKITAGICLQTFQDEALKLRDITSVEDITVQMYTGLAAGCHLFEYFLYRSYDSIGLYGIVDSTGQKRIYDYVAEANERMRPFEKVVLGFDYQGMTVSHGAQSGDENEFEAVSEFITNETGSLTKMVSRYDAIAGHLKKGDQDGYMVVNYTDPAEKLTNIVTLTFSGCQQVLVITEDGSYQQDLVDGGVLRLTLPTGAAAFVIPV